MATAIDFAPTNMGTLSVAIYATGYVLPHLGSNCNLTDPLSYSHTIQSASKLEATCLAEMARLTPREAKKLDRFSMLSLAAASRALGEIDVSTFNARWGIIISNSIGGWEFTERELLKLHQQGAESISPYLATAWFPAAPQGQISLKYPIGNFSKTICGDRCGGSMAISLAAKYIQLGRLDFALAGGVDAPLSPFAFSGLNHSSQKIPLVEGAGLVVLGPAAGIDDGKATDTPTITGSKYFRIPPFLQGQVDKLQSIFSQSAANIEFGVPSTIICSGCIDPDVQPYLSANATKMGSKIIFTTPCLGDSLSATSALGLIAAYKQSSSGRLKTPLWHLSLDRLSAHLMAIQTIPK